jgi:hypothetical protein
MLQTDKRLSLALVACASLALVFSSCDDNLDSESESVQNTNIEKVIAFAPMGEQID